jgi:hypothetical protein
MIPRQHRVTRVMLIIGILVSGGLAGISTASAAGTGPADALAPVNTWQPLENNQRLWYAFNYAGDGSQIQIELQVEPEGGATFEVWTPDLIWYWSIGKDVEPIGRGSDDPFTEGKLIWSGSFATAGTYYVVVEHSGSVKSYYLLDVSGDGVTLPESTPTPTPETAQAEAQPRAQVAPLGNLSGKLVFQTTYGGPFYTINVNGTGLQRITNGIDPAWSPDGQQIAFVRWEQPRGVWLVDADGSNERRLFDWNEARWPTWSPDGELILFSRQNGGKEGQSRCFWGRCFTSPGTPYWTLGIVDPDDGAFREPPTANLVHTPDWSPDGERFVYNGERGLAIQSVDGQISYQLTGSPFDTNPVWSPDGDQVAFVRKQHDHWEIYLVDADGGGLTRLTDTPAHPDGTAASSVSPTWSPDGNYIAFFTDRTGEWEIWAMQANGKGQQPLFDTELDGLTLGYVFGEEQAIDWTW